MPLPDSLSWISLLTIFFLESRILLLGIDFLRILLLEILFLGIFLLGLLFIEMVFFGNPLLVIYSLGIISGTPSSRDCFSRNSLLLGVAFLEIPFVEISFLIIPFLSFRVSRFLICFLRLSFLSWIIFSDSLFWILFSLFFYLEFSFSDSPLGINFLGILFLESPFP